MTLVLQHALITSAAIISRVEEKHKTAGFDPANSVEGDQNRCAAGDPAHAQLKTAENRRKLQQEILAKQIPSHRRQPHLLALAGQWCGVGGEGVGQDQSSQQETMTVLQGG